jgi:nitroreductase
MIDKLVLMNRSYRCFHENERIPREGLMELVALAQPSPSAGNLQPLRYILSWEEGRNQLIFPTMEELVIEL